MKKRRRNIPSMRSKFKRRQYVVSLMGGKVMDDELDDIFIQGRSYNVNRRRGSRIGFIENVKPRVK